MQATETIRLEHGQDDEQMSVRASVVLWAGLAILGWMPVVAFLSALG